MPRRVVSILRQGRAALRASDPVLEAHAYALAVDVDLTVVLTGDAVELAVAGAAAPTPELVGQALPWSADGQDLQGLLESGVEVHADAGAVSRRALKEADLLPGVRLADRDRIDALLGDAEAVVTW